MSKDASVDSTETLQGDESASVVEARSGRATPEKQMTEPGRRKMDDGEGTVTALWPWQPNLEYTSESQR